MLARHSMKLRSQNNGSVQEKSRSQFFIIILIMEICKHPTYQNIFTAQGAYTNKNSDNMLQHKIKFNKIHIHLLHNTHTYTHRHACSMHTSIQAFMMPSNQVNGYFCLPMHQIDSSQSSPKTGQ